MEQMFTLYWGCWPRLAYIEIYKNLFTYTQVRILSGTVVCEVREFWDTMISVFNLGNTMQQATKKTLKLSTTSWGNWPGKLKYRRIAAKRREAKELDIREKKRLRCKNFYFAICTVWIPAGPRKYVWHSPLYFSTLFPARKWCFLRGLSTALLRGCERTMRRGLIRMRAWEEDRKIYRNIPFLLTYRNFVVVFSSCMSSIPAIPPLLYIKGPPQRGQFVGEISMNLDQRNQHPKFFVVFALSFATNCVLRFVQKTKNFIARQVGSRIVSFFRVFYFPFSNYFCH